MSKAVSDHYRKRRKRSEYYRKRRNTNYNNDDMNEIKMALLNIKSHLKTLNNDTGDDIFDKIENSFNALKSDLLRNIKNDLNDIVLLARQRI